MAGIAASAIVIEGGIVGLGAAAFGIIAADENHPWSRDLGLVRACRAGQGLRPHGAERDA